MKVSISQAPEQPSTLFVEAVNEKMKNRRRADLEYEMHPCSGEVSKCDEAGEAIA